MTLRKHRTTMVPMWRVFLCLLMLPITAFAQQPGTASFIVYEKGRQTGTLETAVTRTEDGWRIQSSTTTTGGVPIRIVNLLLEYDRNWFGRWMTMEMKSPDNVIVHVAVSRTTAHTDVVRPREARFRSHSVSPDTLIRPDRGYAAYEAVAARLAGGTSVVDLPLFVPPDGETRAVVESVVTEQVQTTAGPIAARRYVLTEIHTRPTRVELWTDRGRLLRLDLPALQTSVVRSDVRR